MDCSRACAVYRHQVDSADAEEKNSRANQGSHERNVAAGVVSKPTRQAGHVANEAEQRHHARKITIYRVPQKSLLPLC